MNVYSAREEIFTGSLNLFGRQAKSLTELFDFSAFDTDIGLMDVTVGDDSAVANDEISEPLFYSLQSRG
jgi:hypothetical protein